MPSKLLALLVCISLLFAPLAGHSAGFMAYAAAAGDASQPAHGEHCGADDAAAAGTACPHCAEEGGADCCITHHGCCLGSVAALPAAATARAFASGGALIPIQPTLRPLARSGGIFRPPPALS